jgi:hypothetical protein
MKGNKMAQQDTMINYGSRTNTRRIEETEKEIEALMKRRPPKESQEEEVQEEQEETPEEKLTAEERNWKKRYGDLRSHSTKKEQELTSRIEALEGQLQSASVDMPTSEDDLEQWKKDHPKVYARVEAIAEKIAQAKLAKQEERFKQIEERDNQTKRERAELKIREEHSDFDTLRGSDEFHAWVDDQPKWVQDALYKNEDDPRSVIRAIDLYKLDKGIGKTKDKRKPADAMQSVRSTNGKPNVSADGEGRKFRESEIKKMSDRQFEEALPEIEKAKREGRIIYDLSR